MSERDVNARGHDPRLYDHWPDVPVQADPDGRTQIVTDHGDAALSSSGPGSRPFTAETGVRFSAALPDLHAHALAFLRSGAEYPPTEADVLVRNLDAALIQTQQERDSYKQRYETVLATHESGRESVYWALGIRDKGASTHKHALEAVKGLQERVKFTECFESVREQLAALRAALDTLVKEWRLPASIRIRTVEGERTELRCADALAALLKDHPGA